MAERFFRKPMGLTMRRWRNFSSAWAMAMALPGCASGGMSTTSGPSTKMQSDRIIQRAIRQSSEGVILLPSSKADTVYELPRLNEIAQGLRQPAAACFLRRAIETMEPSPADERGFTGIPEGQLRVRVRIAPSGEVVRTEEIESGFDDPTMSPCIQKAIAKVKWPENKTGNNQFVDVVYWVSLGAQADVHTPAYVDRLKRETVEAGVRAKKCLQGRVGVGQYEVIGLNLLDREGNTLVNRVEEARLPQPVRACVAAAFRQIQLTRQPESFVRPIAPTVKFAVNETGVAVDGEDWLRVVQLEERALRAEERRRLGGDDVEPEDGSMARDEGPIDVVDEPVPSEPETPPSPTVDPGQGGIKLDLGGRRPRS